MFEPPDKSDPSTVLDEIINKRHDYSAASVATVLLDLEANVAEGGWDQPTQLAIMYRALPPTHLADQIAETLHGNLMLISMSVLPLDLSTYDGPMLSAAMHWLAEGMQTEEALQAYVSSVPGDVAAWVLIHEAWMVSMKTDNPDDFDGEVDGMQPSQHPLREEIRNLLAVDRAGYRYQVSRVRNGEPFLNVDFGEKPEHQLVGNLPDALAVLMEATPLRAAEEES